MLPRSIVGKYSHKSQIIVSNDIGMNVKCPHYEYGAECGNEEIDCILENPLLTSD